MSQDASIKISIITVCFNDLCNLKKTIRSFFLQLEQIDGRNVEYIVVDGASTDGTVAYVQELFQEMQKKGVSTCLVSEKDKGIYDAMNKGSNLACGKWVYMLNAGDVFHDGTVLKKMLEHMQSSTADVLYGSAYRKNPYWGEMWIPSNLDRLRKTMILCHQSILIRKRLMETFCYDLQYRWCADYDLILRLYLKNYQFHYMNICVVDYSLDGVTAQEAMIPAYKEIWKIRKANGVTDFVVSDVCKYRLGLWKRYLIKILPQSVRWEIVRILHKCNRD